MTARSPRILIAEDEALIAIDLDMQLRDLGYTPVRHATRGDEAIELARTLQPDLVLLDHMRHAMLAASRTGQRGAVMFLDLDRFKHINDSLGLKVIAEGVETQGQWTLW